VTSIDGPSFVAGLVQRALDHRAANHPFLAELGTERLALFARHYHGYSCHFPRYLTATISRLDEPAHRSPLVANLIEESGSYDDEELEVLAAAGVKPEWIVGVPHPKLFERFCETVGVTPPPSDSVAPEVRAWREMFYRVIVDGSPAEAVGAIGIGTEAIVSHVYRPFVGAIERAGLDAAGTVFFPLHAEVDDNHQATLAAIAADLAADAEGRRGLELGMTKALMLRDAFFTWLLGQAER
jgi:pyrroloquinoline quinone (PQQ) biosynthesis protein C